MSHLRLALIPPVSLLDYTAQTTYQLALPRMDDKAYTAKYRQRSDRGDYVILDNGVAEGWDITPTALEEYSNTIKASELVLPDVIKSSVATVELTKAAIHRYTSATSHLPHMQYMGVVQGGRLSEFKWCVQQYYRMPISVLGIPRHMLKTCNSAMARVEFVQWILTQFPHRFRIHFLGMDGDEPYEAWHIFNQFHNTIAVRGMDTSLPFNYAYQSESISHPKKKCHRPNGYFELPADDFSPFILRHNVHQLKKWFYAYSGSEIGHV